MLAKYRPTRELLKGECERGETQHVDLQVGLQRANRLRLPTPVERLANQQRLELCPKHCVISLSTSDVLLLKALRAILLTLVTVSS